ncbi:MAG: ELWxxDGT repeat protein [Pirellulales bacterium]
MALGTSRAATRYRRLGFDLLERRQMLAAVPERLLDLNQDTRPSSPQELASSNGSIYFTAFPGVCRSSCDTDIRQVWRTDGTAAGSQLLAEFSSPSANLAIGEFTQVGTTTYFVANADLWKTDGTAAGTVKVHDFNAFPPPRELTNVNGTLFFVASDGSQGTELWKSDGTTAGTVLVKEIEAGSFGSDPRELTVMNGTLYFVASDMYRALNRDYELWKSDGTAGGTSVVADLIPGATGSQPSSLEAVGNRLFFFATDGVVGKELWTTDGSVAGTQLVKDINPGVSGTPSSNSIASGDIYYFRIGISLYRSDGTAAGTTVVADSSGNILNPIDQVDAGGVLYVGTNSGLWRTNGTPAGTIKLSSNSANRLTRAGSQVFYTDFDELWVSDGTAAGTRLAKPFPNVIAQTITMAGLGNYVYFDVDDGIHGVELWRSDGSTAGTTLVKDVNTITTDSTRVDFGYKIQFTEYSRQALFSASSGNGAQGHELWRTDGTAAGTILLADSVPGSGSTGPNELQPLSRGVVYAGNTSSAGRELYLSDATTVGTGLLKDIRTGVITGSPASGSPSSLAVLGDTVYFSASGDSASIPASNWLGIELWKSDGTAAGTTLVKDINTGSTSSLPRRLTVAGNKLYLFASSSVGAELWVSDGTANGTALVKDIYPGTGGFGPGFLTPAGNLLYFAADDGSNGTELWRTDGTTAGTTLVKDIRAGGTGSIVAQIENAVNQVGMNWAFVNGLLYFIADDGVNGEELWRSDGTAAGTVLVKDIAAGATSSSPRYLTAFGNQLVFTAATSGSGREIWISDGTSAGTTMVKEIFPGVTGSEPAYLAAIHDSVYFSANDGVAGYELWKTNGTAAGTVLVGDLRPGPFGSDPSDFKFIDGTMYFTADDGVTGYEPWTIDLVPVLDVVLSPTSIAENSGFHATLGTVTRRKSADISAPLLVTLSTSDSTEALPAATVTIPANQTSAPFAITAVDDLLLDGTQTVRITATASGFAAGFADLQVTDFETLSLSFNKSSIGENQGAAAATATVTRSNTDLSAPLVVTIAGSDSSEATAPATVTILANQASATFDIQAIDDSLLDGEQTASFTVSAAGYQSAMASLVVTDHETLTVAIAPGSVAENGGVSAASVTVTRNNTDRFAALIVSLAGSDASEISVPTTLTIPAGQASASISITAVDDSLLDGTQTATITATAAGYVAGSASISITDVETLSLTLDQGTFAENAASPAATATVTRNNTDISLPLIVNIASSDASEATAPTTVTIPANQSSTTFAITAIDDAFRDGSQTVTFTATAAGYNSASAQATVTDHETIVVTINTASIAENAGNAATTATVTRSNTDRALSLVVTLSNSDTSEARVPASVTIPANQASITFNIDAIDDTLLDGTQAVTITPSASGYVAVGAALSVTDVETLAITVSPSSWAENAGVAAATATITRSNTDRTSPLTVTVTNPDSSELSTPTTVVIPANQASVTFPIDAVDDNLLDGAQNVTLQVSAEGYAGASRVVTVTDHETLQLQFDSSSIAENGGTTRGVVTRANSNLSQPLIVSLASADAGEASVPASVTILAGETSAEFTVTGVDDSLLDGTQSIFITATAVGYAGSSQLLSISDHEILTISISIPTLSERGGTTTATVSRGNTDRAAPLHISLVVGDASEATAPSTVTIAANQASASFTLTGVDDSLLDGPILVSISATAAGYVAGEATFTVTDSEALTLTFDTNVTSENGGQATATVTRSNTDQSSPLTVTLTNSDSTEVEIPTSVVIPAGAASTTFLVQGVDDNLLDGVQLATLRALADSYETATAFFLVTDWETLQIDIPNTPLIETGAAVLATVTRSNSDISSPLTVTLISDDPLEAAPPATIVIPVQQSSVTFPLNAFYDGEADGTSTVVIRAAADGYQSGAATATVEDWVYPWSNVLNPLDVSRDGDLTPLDALEVITDLNERGARVLPAPTPQTTPPPFIDVNQDTQVTPIDALLVINALNELPASEGEEATILTPESSWIVSPPLQSLALVALDIEVADAHEASAVERRLDLPVFVMPMGASSTPASAASSKVRGNETGINDELLELLADGIVKRR